jgi:hypothetical protein
LGFRATLGSHGTGQRIVLTPTTAGFSSAAIFLIAATVFFGTATVFFVTAAGFFGTARGTQ